MSPARSEIVSSAPSSATQPTLDSSRLADWRERSQHSAPTFVCELIDGFLNDTTTQFAILQRAVEAGDAAACHFSAHRLKSSCYLVGALRLVLLFEELDLLAKHGAVAFLGSQFEEIKAEYGRLELALADERY